MVGAVAGRHFWESVVKFRNRFHSDEEREKWISDQFIDLSRYLPKSLSLNGYLLTLKSINTFIVGLQEINLRAIISAILIISLR
jgi:hypothetical protein